MTGEARVVIKEKSTPWLIWLLPVLALCIGAWLVYKSYRDAGVEVVFLLPLGSGIMPNETEIKYEGVRLGVIKSTALSSDLKKVRATAELDKRASILLQPDTVFWLVQPKITITQIRDLDTLVSGKYITFQLGKQTSKLTLEEIKQLVPEQFEYEVQTEEPPRPAYLGGLQLDVVSTSPVSISEGAPVTFQKFTVGEVDKVTLSEDGQSIHYHVFIQEKYKNLINTKTRFWNASGISVKGSLSNVEIKMDSLTSVLIGGISFGSEPSEGGSQPVDNFHQFVLFDDQEDAFSKKTLIRIRFTNGDGLAEGMPVKYNGLQIGEVESVDLQPNFKGVTVTVNIYDNAVRGMREGNQFWVVRPELGLAGTRNLDTLVGGKYITVQPGAGKPAREFVGLEAPPAIHIDETDKQLKIVLLARQLGSIKKDTKVYYRNVAVGHIDGSELSSNANEVRIYATIDSQYAPLIREHTRFWNASGIDVGFKLFGGLKMKTESVESLLEGGVAFATPDNDEMGNPVATGATFQLYEKAEEGWEKWSPTIPLNAK